MDGFHWTDLLVLVVLGLLVFGPKRLPDIGSSVGAALRELRITLREESSPRPNTTVNTTTDTTPATSGASGENGASTPVESAERSSADEAHLAETGPPV